MQEDLQALRIIALKNAMAEPDAEAEWRRVCRWYSKTFHTPLHEIESLPTFDVWQAFFEERADNLDDADLHKELEEILEPEGLEKALGKAPEDTAMDDLIRKVQAENAQAKLPKPPKALQQAAEDLGKAVDDIQMIVEQTGEFSLDFDGVAFPEGKPE